MLPFPGLHVRLEYDVQWDTLSRINMWVYGSCMSIRTRPYALQNGVLSTMSDGTQTQTSVDGVYGGDVCLWAPRPYAWLS